VKQATLRDGTVVKDIRGQTTQTVSSITTVNLDDISHIEEIFSVVLAAGAMALFVALAVAERRQEFATMAAVGASLGRVGAFLWSEAGFVLAAAALLAAALGWLLAKMLVAMLTHAFDPPPDHLAVPWAFLGELSAATLAATVIAIALAARRLRRLPLGAILREQ
jgi:putative ABC transport system permease protein